MLVPGRHEADAPLPQRIGQYRIHRALGRGGMGVVYAAEQENPRREVALKVIRPGLGASDVLKRFEREAHILGRLSHPGIAQIFEAGIAETGQGPQPYFAMELIRGLPLTTYAERKRLTPRERLSLMAEVIDAVQHAHQRGVIHRDLKPGNIFVTEDGQPKVLDFGIARVTESDIHVTTVQTEVGALVGTIPYMSPEQIAGDPNELDTRTDVYSLGVILYELLVGRMPHNVRNKSTLEAARVIREDDHARLSTVIGTDGRPARHLRGDVETIVGKALEKDKSRRYQTANALAADIRRYLNDEPISAQPPSAVYQFRKFALRHRGLVAGLVLTFIALSGGLATSLVLYFQADTARSDAVKHSQEAEDARRAADERRIDAEIARRAESAQRQIAEDEAAKAKAVIAVMNEMFDTMDPQSHGRRDILVSEMLDETAKRIEGAFKGQPDVEVEVRTLLGAAYRGIDYFEESSAMFDAAVALAESLPADEIAPRIGVYKSRGAQYLRQARYHDALDDLGQAEMLMALQHDTSPWDWITLREMKANAQRAILGAAAVFEDSRRILSDWIELCGEESDEVARAKTNLAAILRTMQRAEESERSAREGVATMARLWGDYHPRVLQAKRVLASAILHAGRANEALDLFEDILPGTRAAFGPAGVDAADLLAAMGDAHAKLGRFPEAVQTYREAIEIQERMEGIDAEAGTYTAVSGILSVLIHQGRASEALPYARRILDVGRASAGTDSLRFAMALNDAGLVYRALGDFVQAESFFRQSLDLHASTGGKDSTEYLSTVENLGNVYYSRGNFDESERLVTEVLEARRRILGPDDPAVTRSIFNLAMLRDRRGDMAGAAPLILEAFEQFKAQLGDAHPNVTHAMTHVGRVREWQGDLDAAESTFREVIARVVSEDGEKRARYSGAAGLLAQVLQKSGKFAEAESLFAESLEISERQPGRDTRSIGRNIERMMRFYESWHESQPDDGHDAKAALWRTRLADWQATTQPATSSATTLTPPRSD